MGQPESIREIARKLVEDYRRKRTLDPRVYFAETPADVLAAIAILEEPRFNPVDTEWLRRLGIEA